MTRYLLIVAFLVGCSTTDYIPFYYDQGLPRFEWVEPLVFQHNLELCRSRDVCNAADLFGYNRF
jgi:hypothetical protein